MKFKVVQTSYYTLDEKQIIKFKQAMLECYKESYLEDESKCKYTIEDIDNKVIEDALKDIVQETFDCNSDFYCDGMDIDTHSDSIILDFDKEDIKNCVCIAAEHWVDKIM